MLIIKRLDFPLGQETLPKELHSLRKFKWVYYLLYWELHFPFPAWIYRGKKTRRKVKVFQYSQWLQRAKPIIPTNIHLSKGKVLPQRDSQPWGPFSSRISSSSGPGRGRWKTWRESSRRRPDPGWNPIHPSKRLLGNRRARLSSRLSSRRSLSSRESKLKIFTACSFYFNTLIIFSTEQ